jgi:hypothetical protein
VVDVGHDGDVAQGVRARNAHEGSVR